MSTSSDSIGLGKWPRLLVAGEQITEQQANEVIVRTTGMYFLHCNDRWWNRQVAELVGLDLDPQHGMATFETVQAATERYRTLSLEYLVNSRIMSSYIGGPHGWCNWDGAIGCSNYNIGKWPSVEEVNREWRTIAATFPFLTLEAQLVTDEGEGVVAVGWHVEAGKATLRPRPAPRNYLRPIHDGDDMAGMIGLLMGSPGRERGVSVERLEVALAQVRDSTAAAS